MAVIKKNDNLKAFVAAALALPGVSLPSQQADAADPSYRSDNPVVSYNQASYKESGDRMEVHTNQLTVAFPLADDFEISVNAVRDVTSGASPVLNLLDFNGAPEMILASGASIRDERTQYDVGAGYYGDGYYLGFSTGESKEDDYESVYQSVDYRVSFNEKATTLFLSASYSSDDVWNASSTATLLDEPTEFNERRRRQFMAGIGQVFNRNSVVQFNVGYSHGYGSLSDPYKKSYVVAESSSDSRGQTDISTIFNFLIDTGFVSFLNAAGISNFLNTTDFLDVPGAAADTLGLVDDTRPGERDQWVGLVRASHYLDGTDSALHFDYRYIYDEWDANSHTIDIKWNKDIGNDWMVSPSIRFYTQNSAFFYDVFFEEMPDHGFVSSDYRLAGFGAVSAKLEVVKLVFDKITLRANYEIYERKHHYEFNGESTGHKLDDFTSKMLSLSLNGSF